MAGPACMSGDGNQAVFVGTLLQTGDAVALCDECLVPWAAAMLHAMTGVDPAPFIAAVSDDTQAAGAAEGAPTDEPPAPAPADTDDDAGWAASRVIESEQERASDSDPEDGEPTVGRTRSGRGSGAARTGGGPQGD